MVNSIDGKSETASFRVGWWRNEEDDHGWVINFYVLRNVQFLQDQAAQKSNGLRDHVGPWLLIRPNMEYFYPFWLQGKGNLSGAM